MQKKKKVFILFFLSHCEILFKMLSLMVIKLYINHKIYLIGCFGKVELIPDFFHLGHVFAWTFLLSLKNFLADTFAKLQNKFLTHLDIETYFWRRF